MTHTPEPWALLGKLRFTMCGKGENDKPWGAVEDTEDGGLICFYTYDERRAPILEEAVRRYNACAGIPRPEGVRLLAKFVIACSKSKDTYPHVRAHAKNILRACGLPKEADDETEA